MNRFKRYLAVDDHAWSQILKASLLTLVKFFLTILIPTLIFVYLKEVLEGAQGFFWWTLGAFLISLIAIFIISNRVYHDTYSLAYQESANIRVRLAETLKKLPLSYYSKHSLAEISQTVMMDVGNCELALSHSVSLTLGFTLFLIILTVLMLLGNLWLGLCIVVPMWFTFYLFFASKNLQRHYIPTYYQHLLDNSTLLQGVCDGYQDIRSYQMEKKLLKQISHQFEQTEKWHIKSEFLQAYLTVLIGLLPFLAPALVAIVGAHLMVNGQVSMLYYVGYLMASSTLASQWGNISEMMIMLIYFADSFDRLRSLYDYPVEEGKDVQVDGHSVSIEKVDFSYEPGKPVLKQVEFSAEEGQVTALVGPSGCGKSTMLRLLCRLYDYEGGDIKIGHQSISQWNSTALFKHISFVFQEVHLFNASVYENIRLGCPKASREQVLAAAKAARVDEIVADLPDGYDTLIGEDGGQLSGGQRQRISIARALLKDAPILLLDEISANLDVENEWAIQQSLNQLTKGKTVIVVSHRMKSIEKADHIVVFDQGQVIAQGKHDALLESCALYQDMVKKSELSQEFIY